MAKIEAEMILGRSTDDTAEQCGGGLEGEIRKLCCIAGIPKHSRAGTQVDSGARRMQGKGWRTSNDDIEFSLKACFEGMPQLINRLKGEITLN